MCNFPVVHQAGTSQKLLEPLLHFTSRSLHRCWLVVASHWIARCYCRLVGQVAPGDQAKLPVCLSGPYLLSFTVQVASVVATHW